MTEITERIPRRPTGPHPAPEELYAARRGPRGAEAERVLAHAYGCAHCSAELARQEAFDDPERLRAGHVEAAWQRFVAAEPAAPTRSAARRTPVLALAAALMICALGLGLWRARQQPPALDVERGERSDSEMAAVERQPAGTLAAPPAAFVFASPAGEARRVKVFDETQSYTWTSAPTIGGRIAFPETERRRLRPGVTYFWLVLGGDEQSAAQSFRIAVARPLH